MSTDRMLSASSASFHLPNELWGEVLTHVDDPYHLWVSCRQVSRNFRPEAERAFRIRYLPRMRIQYKTRSRKGNPGKSRVRLKLDADDTSIDPSSGRFILRTSSWQLNPNWRSEPLERRFLNFLSEDQRTRTIKKTLDRDDIDALSRNEEDGNMSDSSHRMHIWFESANTEASSNWRYANDVEIPEMRLHLRPFVSDTTATNTNIYMREGHVHLDWRSLLTSLFSEETFVRRKLVQAGTPVTSTTSLATLLDTTMVSIFMECASFVRSGTGCTMHERDKPRYEVFRDQFIQAVIATQGSHHARLYEEAYDARLRSAYANDGFETPPDSADASYAEIGKYYTYVATHVRLMQEFRNENLKKSAEKCWQKRFGTVEFHKLHYFPSMKGESSIAR